MKRYLCIITSVILFMSICVTSVSAASFNENVGDSELRYLVGGCTGDTTKNTGLASLVDEPIPDGYPDEYPSLSTEKKYIEHFSVADNIFSTYRIQNYTLSSDSEIVALLIYNHTDEDNKVFDEHSSSIHTTDDGRFEFLFFSKSQIHFKADGYWFWQNVWDTNDNYIVKESFASVGLSFDGYACCGMNTTYNSSEALTYAVKTGKMKVFTTAKDCFNYLDYGIEDGLAWQGASPKYDGDAYLENFQMIVHDSNSYDAYYIEFKYKIPDKLKECGNLYLDIEEEFNYGTSGIVGSINIPQMWYGDNNIDLLKNPTGFKLSLDNIQAVNKFVSQFGAVGDGINKRKVLGSEFLVDTSKVTIDGVGGETIFKITNSKLYLDCYVVADNKFGQSVSGTIDFISGQNSIGSYTPDASGNYTYNNDYQSNGHYYTNVGSDAAGNTTYNYYYYTTDNSKHEISSQDSIDNSFTDNSTSSSSGSSNGSGSISNVNNPTFTNNNTITVEGDSINNEVNNYVEGNTTKKDSENFIEKFLGFFELLENNSFLGVWAKVFAWLPSGVSTLITSAMGLTCGVAVFKFFRK